MGIVKLRKKYNRTRVLKAISYLLGFPLFVLLVFVGSLSFFKTDGFADTKLYGTILALALWVLLTVFQFIFAAATKTYNGRTVWLVLLTVVLMMGGACFFDYFYANKKIEELQEKYVYTATGKASSDTKAETFTFSTSVSIQDYNKMVSTYTTFLPEDFAEGVSKTEVYRYNKEIARFENLYNVKFKSEVFGATNSDGSDYTYDKKTDAYLSENGMYADGHIFSVEQSVDILIDYYTAPIKYFINNSASLTNKVTNKVRALQEVNLSAKQKAEIDMFANIDLEKVSVFPTPSATLMDAFNEIMEEAYKTALNNVKSSSEWSSYTRSDEYEAAYGDDGTAWKFMFDEARLDDLIGKLGIGLANLSDSLGDLTLYKSLVAAINSLAGTNLTTNDLRNLSIDSLLELVEGLGLNLGELLGGLLGSEIEGEIDADVLVELLGLVVGYQSPSVRPQFDFIKDNEIKAYAYAKYYGITHGGNVGSVLIGENLGHVTMTTTGYAKEYGFTLTELYQLKADLEYIPFMFPLFAARRYVYICAGLIALSFVFYYKRQKKEDALFDEIFEGKRGY